MASNFWSSCLHLPHAGIIGVFQHAWLHFNFVSCFKNLEECLSPFELVDCCLLCFGHVLGQEYLLSFLVSFPHHLHWVRHSDSCIFVSVSYAFTSKHDFNVSPREVWDVPQLHFQPQCGLYLNHFPVPKAFWSIYIMHAILVESVCSVPSHARFKEVARCFKRKSIHFFVCPSFPGSSFCYIYPLAYAEGSGVYP